MTDNHYDENIVSQLMVFGYSKQQIIEASNSVVDYKDINTVQAKLDAAEIEENEIKEDDLSVILTKLYVLTYSSITCDFNSEDIQNGYIKIKDEYKKSTDYFSNISNPKSTKELIEKIKELLSLSVDNIIYCKPMDVEDKE
eukprot:338176_1